jgi:AAA family ATP:ADP antiporter
MSYSPSSDRTRPLQRLLSKAADIRPYEVRAVTLSMLYFFFLFGSYSVVKPVRDAMGTVYGMAHIQELFTGTFLVSLILAPLYSALASRMRLSTFLPWVYGFIVVTILIFFGLFQNTAHDRSVAAAFYVWVSTFNILTISVFWSFMADTFSRAQASRLFGFIAAGGTAGGIAGPAIATLLAKSTGNNGLMLVSAVGFAATAALVVLLAKEKRRLASAGVETQHTTLDHRLPGTTLDGIRLLFRSRYLLLIALFLLLMTWISTVVYIQLGELITKSFTDRAARTQAYATIDLTVNSITLFLQLFGTGRLIKRFGVTTGLMVNPVIMIWAFIAMVFAPVLLVLGGIQVLRRVAEYAIAKPTREMLFTVVDQESKYKAKNIIDTVVYRFGDLSSAWVSSFILPFGVAGLAIFGAVIAAIWFPVAYALGRRYETERPPERRDTAIDADVSKSQG